MSRQRRADVTESVHDVDEPGGYARIDACLDEGVATRGREFRRFDHDAVACQQRGEDLPRRDRDGEVPWRDHPHDTDGVTRRESELVGHLARVRRTPRSATLPCDEASHVDGFLHVAAGFDQDLAGLARHEPRQVGLARREHVADRGDRLGTRRHRDVRPRPLRGHGAGDGIVDDRGVGGHERGNHIVGVGGIAALEAGHRRELLACGERKRPRTMLATMFGDDVGCANRFGSVCSDVRRSV